MDVVFSELAAGVRVTKEEADHCENSAKDLGRDVPARFANLVCSDVSMLLVVTGYCS